MSAVVGQMKLIGPATVRGRLYDLGEYPGLVLEQGAAVVKGQLLQIPNQQILEQLDRYEACPLPDSPQGLFRRVKTTASEYSGQASVCWVYVYNRDVTRVPLVECGCWLTYRRADRMKQS
jgi:gamma-glutamylcyclotransferase (GGCT)/AIG2-like uncharacterized protein YtfP